MQIGIYRYAGFITQQDSELFVENTVAKWLAHWTLDRQLNN